MYHSPNSYGDYTSTADMSLIQHGAYRVMLMLYLLTEKPLPSNRKILHRSCRALTKKERDAIDAVAERFFTVDGDSLRIHAIDDALRGQKNERGGGGTTFLYLMRNNRNGLVKIGISDEPRTRERTLQSEEPEIELLRYWTGTRTLERELHAKFSERRARGEWFRLDEQDVAEITVLMEGRNGH